MQYLRFNVKIFIFINYFADYVNSIVFEIFKKRFFTQIRGNIQFYMILFMYYFKIKINIQYLKKPILHCQLDSRVK